MRPVKSRAHSLLLSHWAKEGSSSTGFSRPTRCKEAAPLSNSSSATAKPPGAIISTSSISNRLWSLKLTSSYNSLNFCYYYYAAHPLVQLWDVWLLLNSTFSLEQLQRLLTGWPGHLERESAVIQKIRRLNTNYNRSSLLHWFNCINCIFNWYLCVSDYHSRIRRDKEKADASTEPVMYCSFVIMVHYLWSCKA